MFGHTHHYYLDAFKREGLPIRSNKINSRRYELNHNYFNEINTHEKAYWLGFIYADGYISMANGKKFGVSLAIKDIDHLHKLNKCLNSNYPVKIFEQKQGYVTGSKYCRLLVSSDQMVDDLIQLGVVENKTNILKAPQINRTFYSSFILGYFDGDGSIYCNHTKYPHYSINIVGTDNMLEFIHNYFKDIGLINRDINLEKRKPNQIVSNIRYGGNIIVTNILDKLYESVDKSLPLSRKRELYLKCKNRIFS